jgi:hypothetical protein
VENSVENFSKQRSVTPFIYTKSGRLLDKEVQAFRLAAETGNFDISSKEVMYEHSNRA